MVLYGTYGNPKCHALKAANSQLQIRRDKAEKTGKISPYEPGGWIKTKYAVD